MGWAASIFGSTLDEGCDAREDSRHLQSKLAAAGYPTTEIGRMRDQSDGLLAQRGGKTIPLPTFAVDEIAKLF